MASTALSALSRRAFIAATFCVSSLSLTAAAAQDGAIRLQISDKVGQTSRYRLSFKIEMRADVEGQGEPAGRAKEVVEALASGMDLRTAVEYEQRLLAVAPDGVRTFEVRWHDYQFDGELAGKEIPPPPGYIEATRELLSQTARVRTTPTGRTIDVTYAHPELSGHPRGLESMEGAMPVYLPERPVTTGERWTSTAEIPLGMAAGSSGSLTLELEHTLREVVHAADGPVAVIELSGSYSQLKGLEEAGFGEPMHMQATLTGSSHFDITRGRYLGGRYEIDMFALHAAGGVEIQVTGHANGDLELLSGR